MNSCPTLCCSLTITTGLAVLCQYLYATDPTATSITSATHATFRHAGRSRRLDHAQVPRIYKLHEGTYLVHSGHAPFSQICPGTLFFAAYQMYTDRRFNYEFLYEKK